MSDAHQNEKANESPLRGDVTPKTLAAVGGGLLGVIIVISVIFTVIHNRQQTQLILDFNQQVQRETGVTAPPPNMSAEEQKQFTLQQHEESMARQRESQGSR